MTHVVRLREESLGYGEEDAIRNGENETSEDVQLMSTVERARSDLDYGGSIGRTSGCLKSTIQFFQKSAPNWRQKRLPMLSYLKRAGRDGCGGYKVGRNCG